MHISLSDDRTTGQLTIALGGSLDGTEAIALADRILNLLPKNPPEVIVIDLTACSIISNQGLSALVSLALAPELEKSQLHVTGHSMDTAKRMLALKLDRIFQFPEATTEPESSQRRHKEQA